MQITGAGTALVTPFSDGAIDLEALEDLIAFQIEAGIDFIVPCGTTGESSTLTDPERVAVIERTVGVVNGRVPVVAGTGTNDTPHSVAMTQAARKAGADACLAVAPYYNNPSQEGVYRHVRAMIDEGGLPAVVYHIPSRGCVPIEVETVARLVASGGVAGLKETGGVSRITDLRQTCDVSILSGDDALTLPMICLGATGVVSVASNALPHRVKALVDAARQGDVETALGIHEALSPMFRALFSETNPVPVKAALVILGLLEDPAVRLPLVEASGETGARLLTALARIGLPTPA